MLGIGWTEFVLVALVLLVFVGPKHLPGMLRKFGQLVAELRSASRELRNQIELEVNDLGVDDLKSPSEMLKEIGRDMETDIRSPYDDVVAAAGDTKRELESITDNIEDQTLEAGEPNKTDSDTMSKTNPNQNTRTDENIKEEERETTAGPDAEEGKKQ